MRDDYVNNVDYFAVGEMTDPKPIRPKPGRPRLDPTGERRNTHSFHVTASELSRLKEFLAGLRK